MEIVKIKVTAINKEENKLGWVITEFKQILTIEDMMEPFKALWNIALTFRSEYASWTRSPIFNLDGKEVGKTHGTMAEKMANLKDIFEDNEAAGPSGVAKQILDKLNSFSMYIPLIISLTNSRMTDVHWKEISEILGFEISPEDGSINWTNLMAQGALSQENIDKIALLDAAANKDYDLVVFREFLDEMEVDSLMFKIMLGVDRSHPWAVGGKCLMVDVENITRVVARVGKHIDQIVQISENANGEEFAGESRSGATSLFYCLLICLTLFVCLTRNLVTYYCRSVRGVQEFVYIDGKSWSASAGDAGALEGLSSRHRSRKGAGAPDRLE